MSTDNNKYKGVTSQNSDVLSAVADRYLEGSILDIINKFPIGVHVVLQGNRTKVNFGLIEAHENISVPYNIIGDGDILHFLYFDTSDSSLKVVCPPHRIKKIRGSIIIGASVSYTQTYKRDYSPSSDVTSINVHNTLPWDITIAIGNRPVMFIQKNRNLTGSLDAAMNITNIPGVYFNDLSRGINIGTKFDVYADMNKTQTSTIELSKNTYLHSFTLADVNEDHIFVGLPNSIVSLVTKTGMNSRNSGVSIYRLGENNYENPKFLPGKNTKYSFRLKNQISNLL